MLVDSYWVHCPDFPILSWLLFFPSVRGYFLSFFNFEVISKIFLSHLLPVDIFFLCVNRLLNKEDSHFYTSRKIPNFLLDFSTSSYLHLAKQCVLPFAQALCLSSSVVSSCSSLHLEPLCKFNLFKSCLSSSLKYTSSSKLIKTSFNHIWYLHVLNSGGTLGCLTYRNDSTSYNLLVIYIPLCYNS